MKAKLFNPFTPKSAEFKTELKSLNFTLQNCQKQTTPLLLSSFYLSGHTLGFHPQTQKLEPHLLTQGLTLGAKGLICLYVQFKVVMTMLQTW